MRKRKRTPPLNKIGWCAAVVVFQRYKQKRMSVLPPTTHPHPHCHPSTTEKKNKRRRRRKEGKPKRIHCDLSASIVRTKRFVVTSFYIPRVGAGLEPSPKTQFGLAARGQQSRGVNINFPRNPTPPPPPPQLFVKLQVHSQREAVFFVVRESSVATNLCMKSTSNRTFFLTTDAC